MSFATERLPGQIVIVKNMLRTTTLGRTGLQISAITLGTVELGLDYGIGAAHRPSEVEATDLLHFALDKGVTVIDTARAYGDAERIIGAALKHRRQEYVLVSKVKSVAAEVENLVEASLRELQTDHIDVMMLHCGMELLPDADATGALERCREAGKVRYIGASIYEPEAALNTIRSGRYDCIEVGYSPLDRRPEAEVLAEAEKAGVGILARSVLLKGALSSRYRDLPLGLESLRHCVKQLAQIAGSVEELPAFAYRYVLSRTPPHSALIGTSIKTELLAAIEAAVRGPLSAEQLAAVRTVELENERYLNPGLWPS